MSSRGINKKSAEVLNKIVSDRSRFLDYAKQKFLAINELESQRRKKVRHDLATRNGSLNRYFNIIPYDHNCVKLTDTRLGNEDDYINASFILAPFNIPRYYIATQGPLGHTVVDFWRMVVENHVPVIVCLTAQIDNGIEKCARYWPVKDELLKFYSDKVEVRVSNLKAEKKDIEADSIVRTISVEFYDIKTGQLIVKRRVTQLQFLGWPDHGVPQQTTEVINLIKLTRQLQEPEKPVVVHCSAGCGRTGTFCVIDSAEVLLHQEEDLVIDPILIITNEFRKQRTTMVQAQAQYTFCYKALSDFIQQEE